MVTVVRDVQFLSKPKWTGNLTVVAVSDPWIRGDVLRHATNVPGADVDNLGEVTESARIVMAAVSAPLIGDPLIVATLDKKAVQPAKLQAFLSQLAARAYNKTVVLLPWAPDIHELSLIHI